MDKVRVIVEHALPHRVRLRVPLLADRRPACEHVAAALAAPGAFDRVTARKVTGSLIVEDRERALDPGELAKRIEELVRAERDHEGRLLSEIPFEEHPGPTRIARAVAHAAAGVNADVRSSLDDRADLGTLLPLFFAGAGVTRALRSRELPVPTWFNLLWWSLRSFMTFNFRAVEEEVLDGKEPQHQHDLARSI